MDKSDFWNWFIQNKSALEKIILGEVKNYNAYEDLSERLTQYSEFLIPEITQTIEGDFVLVISCDGVKDGIPFAEEVTSNIPPIEGWKVIKYRQPGPMELIPVNGLLVKRKKIFVTWSKTEFSKYLVTFHMRNFSDNDPRYKVGAILHLDHTIGEFAAMTRIEDVDFQKISLFQSTQNLKNLDDLKEEIDKDCA